MKEEHPIPFDTGLGDTKGNGCNDNDALILPRGKSTVVLIIHSVCGCRGVRKREIADNR